MDKREPVSIVLAVMVSPVPVAFDEATRRPTKKKITDILGHWRNHWYSNSNHSSVGCKRHLPKQSTSLKRELTIALAVVVVLFDTETEGRPTKKQKSRASAKLKAEEGVVLDGIVLLLAKSKADLEDYTNNSHLLILVAFDEAARRSTKKQEELNDHDEILAVVRVIPTSEQQIPCRGKNCSKNAAVSWASNKNPNQYRNLCEYCQVDEFGG